MENIKFNYQIVFEDENKNYIIFSGVTSLVLEDLIDECKSYLYEDLVTLSIVSVSYSPVKPVEDEKK